MNKISDENSLDYILCVVGGGNTEEYLSNRLKIYKHLTELLTLRKNTRIALDLAIDYDGFDTVDGLKSLVDDMVSALKGETKWEKL